MLTSLAEQHKRIQCELAGVLSEYLSDTPKLPHEKKRLRNRIRVLLARDRLTFERRFDELEALEKNENH
jgi:hypothetical protein